MFEICVYNKGIELKYPCEQLKIIPFIGYKYIQCLKLNYQNKTMVHLHNGILHSRREEGAPTLWDSMGGSAEHYAKWNKPGGKRQIPYDLTYKRKLINTMNKQAKYNQKYWNKEQTHGNQGEEVGR